MIPNAPPVETHGLHINDLFDEAKHWLDGDGIKSESEAEGVAKLLDAIRQARKAADEQRKVEKAPHDAAAKAVQEAWTPLLAKCDLAAGAAKDALTPWQRAKEAEQRAEAEKARAEADRLALAAQEAFAAGGGLEALEEAERLLKEAARAEEAAAKLDKAKPQVAGGSRAIGLRTSYRAEVTDYTAFARWAWAHRKEEYESFLNDMAAHEGRGGPVSIPGMIVHAERNAA